MNKFIQNISERGLSNNSRIVIPESSDSRVMAASKTLDKLGFTIIDLNDFKHKTSKYIISLQRKKFSKNWSEDQIIQYLEDPINFAICMTANDDADSVIAGAITPTSKIIRSAIRIVGIKSSSKWVSSLFLMASPKDNQVITYADCGVIPEPNSEQLAVIAGDAAEFHHQVTDDEPRVAFLSFSTNGSADHYRVERVREAVKIFKKRFPKIKHDGEIQFDAAISPEISKMKYVDSQIKGKANVFIFPNLDAGNIAYKITQKIGGYDAWGPLLMGLNKPIHDLSRGCSIEDIVNVAIISTIQKVNYTHI